jgi:hypothetical protein
MREIGFKGGIIMKLSLKSLIVASALFQALSFLFVALLNVILPPYGGTWLGVLTSLYLGYHPEAGPVSVIIGTAYAFISGAVAGAVFGWLYNNFVERF